MGIEYRLARRGDEDGVYFVEVHCFRVPWSFDSIEHDVGFNPDALYVVALDKGHVIGFTGMHIVIDEGHIMNMAVLEEYRRQGVGKKLMESLFELAPEEVRSYTLEVRESNHAAMQLYKQFGFYGVGIRRAYYTSPVENALIMWRTPNGDISDSQNTP